MFDAVGEESRTSSEEDEMDNKTVVAKTLDNTYDPGPGRHKRRRQQVNTTTRTLWDAVAANEETRTSSEEDDRSPTPCSTPMTKDQEEDNKRLRHNKNFVVCCGSK